jgi:hypothetical protein
LSGKARRNTGISGREPGSASGSRHGVGDLFTALRRQGLIADELVLQLATFLRSLDLFLELRVLVRSREPSSRAIALWSLPSELSLCATRRSKHCHASW